MGFELRGSMMKKIDEPNGLLMKTSLRTPNNVSENAVHFCCSGPNEGMLCMRKTLKAAELESQVSLELRQVHWDSLSQNAYNCRLLIESRLP